MESIKQKSSEKALERESEIKLDEILNDPNNAFLSEHDNNLALIDNAPTAQEALSIAEELIWRRLEQTYRYQTITHIEGVDVELADVYGVKKRIDTIKEHQLQIGEGGDAFVVVDKSDMRELPPEVCYKFAKTESTPRGRNPLTYEAELQGDFFDIVTELTDSKITVPEAYYVAELGNDKMLAMEKLPAKSVDDILLGKGTLPDWLDLDVFCSELKSLIDVLHQKGLYHRDMHVGNVMIRQTEKEPEDGKWGYVIDFGLSGYGMEGLDPYKKEVAGELFTYNDDYVIIEEVSKSLSKYRERKGKSYAND